MQFMSQEQDMVDILHQIFMKMNFSDLLKGYEEIGYDWVWKAKKIEVLMLVVVLT